MICDEGSTETSTEQVIQVILKKCHLPKEEHRDSLHHGPLDHSAACPGASVSALRPLEATLHSAASVQFSSVAQSDSLRPHELQHARPPCPSPTPGVHSNSRDAIQPSHPLSSPSPPALNPSQHQSFPMSQLFA